MSSSRVSSQSATRTRARVARVVVVAGATMTALVIAAWPVDAQRASGDWTQWRGPNRDGAVGAFTVPQAWPDQLTQRWKVEVGSGYATPLVVGNRIYMFARQGDREVMSALDIESGKVLWSTGHPAIFEVMKAAAPHGPGPKSTPAFANGKLFSIGMTGIVTAYDAASGKQLWQKPGTLPLPLYTSHAFSPVVEGNAVIFHTGGDDKGELVALDVNTGAVKWSWAGDGPGYGSPVVATFDGTRQVVTITQGKLVGIDVATGALLWERPFVIANKTNSVTPVLHGQTLIVSGNGLPTTALRVGRRGNQWTTETAWENADIPMRMSDGVVAGDVLFGMANRNSGQYFAVDATTGKTLWTSEGRQAAHAAIARAGDVFLSVEDDGELVVIRNSKTGFEPVKRYKVSEAATWGQASYSGNRILVKDVSGLTLWTVN
jgi:outer membrane protein assembly factor BamB